MLDLQAPWPSLPLCVLDVETTGFSESDRIADVGAARFEDGMLVAQWSSLVNPGIPIPEQATAVHGITDAMVEHAPRIETVAGHLNVIADGAILCAYNSSFDSKFLAPVLSYTGEWLDVLVIVRDVDKFERGKGRHKLENACARYGVTVTGAHRALPDAIACGMLLFQMLARGKIKNCSAEVLLRHVARRRAEQEAEFQAFMAQQSALEGMSNG